MTQKNFMADEHADYVEVIEFCIKERLPDGSVYCGYYGVNVAKVLEIIRRPVITSVPTNHDPAVLGTFSLRGRVLPLVDLAAWLGKQMIPDDAQKVVVSEFSGVVTAFLVSEVNSIHRLNWDRIEAPAAHVLAYSRESIIGVLRINERILFILDMEKIVSSMDISMDMNRLISEVKPVEDASRFHILIADDSSSLRNTIKGSLEKAGYRVTAVGSGREAWERLLELQRETEAGGGSILDRVHLLITDIEMPEMDGHALTRKIRQTPVLAGLPVMLFSSMITEALRSKGEAVGADEQVAKPDLPRLTRHVRELIARKLRQ